MIEKNTNIWTDFVTKVISSPQDNQTRWIMISKANQDIIEKNKYDYILSELDFNLENFSKTSFYYINNPDGSPRWIFPTNLKHPLFLKMYSTNNLKSRTLAFIIKLIFIFSLQNFILRKKVIHVYHRRGLYYKNWLFINKSTDISIFTGTAGPNRKLVLALGLKKKVTRFIKIPLNQRSHHAIENEIKNYKHLQALNLQQSRIPQFEYLDGVLFLENIERKQRQKANISKILKEIVVKTHKRVLLKDSEYFQEIQKNMNNLVTNNGSPELKYLYKKLSDHIFRLDLESTIELSYAHGDFTPWNLISAKRPGLIDLEYGNDGFPILYDYYNYHIQNTLLTNNADVRELRKKIIELTSSDFAKEMSQIYGIDPYRYFLYYIIGMASKYLNIFSKQDILHEQAYWQINFWNQILSVTVSGDLGTKREIYIKDIFSGITHIDHLWLKGKESINLTSEYSDFDIAIRKKDLKWMVSNMKNHPFVTKLITKRYHNYIAASALLRDGSIVQFDLIFDIARKAYQFMEIECLMDYYQLNKDGIRIPYYSLNFEYSLLFNLLNNNQLPKSQLNKIDKSFKKDKILKYFNRKYNLELKHIEDFSNLNSENRNQIIKRVKRMSSNTPMKRMRRNLSYILYTFSDFIRFDGRVFSFSGVDGAGKTTIINEIYHILDKKYRKKVIILRHRPSLIPILSSFRYGRKKAEEISISKLPRTGTNKSGISSFLRFSYYLTDYIFGHIYINIKYLSRGYYILYDRYYFDFINDAKRTNIVMNSKILKQFYRFIFKPQHNYFLYEEPEVILGRKAELNADTIRSLNEKYINLFNDFSKKYKKSKYYTIKNSKIDTTLNKIEQNISETIAS